MIIIAILRDNKNVNIHVYGTSGIAPMQVTTVNINAVNALSYASILVEANGKKKKMQQ